MVALTPRHTYNASLGLVLRALAHMRAGGALLHAAEWRMYSAALHSNCICERMAAVATVSGDSEEVRTLLGFCYGHWVCFLQLVIIASAFFSL